MSTSVGGIRIVDMPDLGVVTDDSSVVGEHAGSGRFSMPALKSYIGGGGGGALSIKDFGAKSDGVTDDSAAVSAGIAAVTAMPEGGKLIIPSGLTIVGSPVVATIPAGVTLTLEGMGPGASELYFDNGTDGLAFKLLNSGNAWGAVNLHGFSVIRGPVSPAMANVGVNVYADPTANKMCGGCMSFRDLLIQGSTPQGNQWTNSMILSGISGCSLDNINAIGINSTATDLGDALLTITGPNLNQFATSVNIVNSTFQGASVGILINHYVQGAFIANSAIVGQYDSVRWLGGSDYFAEELAIANCTLNAGHRGVYATQVNQNSIAGCTILHFGTGVVAGFAGIELNQTGFNSVVGNNVIGSGSGIENGIIISAVPDQIPNTVVGNVVAGCATRGIWLAGITDSVTVVGNNITGGISAVAQDSYGNTVFANTWNGAPMTQAYNVPIAFLSNVAPDAPRWFVGADGSTESGGNSGNNFEIVGASDAGSPIASGIRINRATGTLSFSITPVNAANDAAAATAGVIVGGVYRNGSVMMVRVA